MKSLDALDKLDQSICLNINNETGFKFGLDTLDGTDCKNFKEFDEVIFCLRKELKVLEQLKLMQKRANIIKFRTQTMQDGYIWHFIEIGDTSFPCNKEEFDLLKEELK